MKTPNTDISKFKNFFELCSLCSGKKYVDTSTFTFYCKEEVVTNKCHICHGNGFVIRKNIKDYLSKNLELLNE